jgi:hypothetical protein
MNLSAVPYKPIPNHPGYLAGLDGSVWSQWPLGTHYRLGADGLPVAWGRWRRLKPGYDKRDRKRWRRVYRVRRIGGTFRSCFGAVLILEAFAGPRPAGMQCCHNDGDCQNDAADNLRWDTRDANIADSIRHGSMRGERNGRAKLNEEQVREIRRLLAAGLPRKQVAARFGVGWHVISFIHNGLTWKHVA